MVRKTHTLLSEGAKLLNFPPGIFLDRASVSRLDSGSLVYGPNL
jgi:hypothetical protein